MSRMWNGTSERRKLLSEYEKLWIKNSIYRKLFGKLRLWRGSKTRRGESRGSRKLANSMMNCKTHETEKLLCDCGSLVQTKNRYCGFCGNRVDLLHINYIRSEVSEVQSLVKLKPPGMRGVLVDERESSPSWIVSRKKPKPKETNYSLMNAGSPVPIFMLLTTVMIWIGGVIFFFVEITF